ncbi:hypothetical protein VN97_g6096 [Penicillium thymicola]|uniref:Uncharacterized protein n=1 Tax=Penicillium thymicola TaxID=293382 RepID=A0AAI9X8L9_PENTH|nr:hypothetical protein VN97_g6096 [Penicillium thymicola]
MFPCAIDEYSQSYNAKDVQDFNTVNHCLFSHVAFAKGVKRINSAYSTNIPRAPIYNSGFFQNTLYCLFCQPSQPRFA